MPGRHPNRGLVSNTYEPLAGLPAVLPNARVLIVQYALGGPAQARTNMPKPSRLS